MTQAGVERMKAAEALKENDNDIVNSIMALRHTNRPPSQDELMASLEKCRIQDNRSAMAI